jgi:hypothetical protein
MAPDDGRSPEQIREEIQAERAKLDTALGAFGAGAKRSGKLAGSAIGALGTLLIVARRLRRRKRSS